MFAGLLQPTDAYDINARQVHSPLALSYSAKFSVMHRYMHTFAGFCKQNHLTEKLTFQCHVLSFFF